VAEDVQLKVTIQTAEAERSLVALRGKAKAAAGDLDRATGGDGSAKGRVPAGRSAAQRFAAGGGVSLGSSLRSKVGLGALAAKAAAIVGPGFEAASRPGATLSDFGGGVSKGLVNQFRSIPVVGQAIGAAFDRTVGTALNVREQAIQATAQATSGLAAAGVQVDPQTMAQINAVQMEMGLRQVRNEAAARRAAPGILDSVLALGLE